MKAYELHPDQGFAGLRLVDRPSPELGARDVRVRIHAVSLNYRDVAIARASRKRPIVIIPTSDGAGEVTAVGSGVTRVKVGDRVAAAFFPTWLDGDLRQSITRARSAAPSTACWRKRSCSPRRRGCACPRAGRSNRRRRCPAPGVTAWNALFVAASLKVGDRVLVQGTGGVSIFALQLARASGATVIATSSSAAKRARLETMGAAATIDYRENANWGEAVRDAAGGEGIDVAVEVGGAGTFDQSVKALRFGGTMSLIGVLAGMQGPVNTYAVLQKGIRVHGVYVGSARMFEALVRALDASTIEPVIDRVFSFEQARAAYEHLASGAHFGKVVIRVG